VALTQLIQARRENQRWKRETEQHSFSRIYDHRREAYVDFLARFEQLRLSIGSYDPATSAGPDPGEIEGLFDSLDQRLIVIRIYGSDAAYNAAAKAMKVFVKWTYVGRYDHEVIDEEAVDKARDDYIELVRKNLGVSEPAGSTALIKQ
jgi:hypothetical protein